MIIFAKVANLLVNLSVLLLLLKDVNCQASSSASSVSGDIVFGSNFLEEFREIFPNLDFGNLESFTWKTLIELFLAQIPHIESETKCLKEQISLISGYYIEFYYLQFPRTITWFRTFESIHTIGQSEVYFASGDGIPRVRLAKSKSYSIGKTRVTVSGTSVAYHFTHSVVGDTQKLSDDTSFSREWDCDLSLDTCFGFYRMFQHIGDFNSTADDWSGDAAKFCRNMRGSGSCKVDMGDEVQLIYWPPENNTQSSQTDGKISSVTLDAVTFGGLDIYLVSEEAYYLNGTNTIRTTSGPDTNIVTTSSILSGPFVLTSPTVYLAHRDIILSNYDNWKRFLNTSFARTAGVVALQPHQVSTIFPNPRIYGNEGSDFVEAMKKGNFGEHMTRANTNYWDMSLRPMNFNDLANPVPASAYYNARSQDCWGKQTHCGTITDDTFRPLLAFKREVWQSILPGAGADCIRFGIVDPPVAITQIAETTLKVATLPEGLGESLGGSSSSPIGQNDGMAYPGPVPVLSLPRPTAEPVMFDSTGNQNGQSFNGNEQNGRFGGLFGMNVGGVLGGLFGNQYGYGGGLVASAAKPLADDNRGDHDERSDGLGPTRTQFSRTVRNSQAGARGGSVPRPTDAEADGSDGRNAGFGDSNSSRGKLHPKPSHSKESRPLDQPKPNCASNSSNGIVLMFTVFAIIIVLL